MNLFEYLKWLREERKKEARTRKLESINEEIAILSGETEGLKAQAVLLEEENKNLVLSNVQDVCDIVDKFAKKVAKKEYLIDLRKRLTTT